MDDVTTSAATVEDVDELYEFMLDDFLQEPSLNAAIGLTREDAAQCYRGEKMGNIILVVLKFIFQT